MHCVQGQNYLFLMVCNNLFTSEKLMYLLKVSRSRNKIVEPYLNSLKNERTNLFFGKSYCSTILFWDLLTFRMVWFWGQYCKYVFTNWFCSFIPGWSGQKLSVAQRLCPDYLLINWFQQIWKSLHLPENKRACSINIFQFLMTISLFSRSFFEKIWSLCSVPIYQIYLPHLEIGKRTFTSKSKILLPRHKNNFQIL